MTPTQMETRIIRDLKLSPNEKAFLYLPQSQFTETGNSRVDSPTKQSEKDSSPSKAVDSPKRTGTRTKLSDLSPGKVSAKSQDSLGLTEPLEDILPEEIHTSLFL